MLEAIRTVYDYSAWANTRLLDAAGRLKLHDFIANNDGVGSIRDLLVHTAWAQAIWLRRCQDAAPIAPWSPAEYPYVATLRERWGEVEAETQGYLGSLADDDLQRAITYVNLQGETWSYPLWQALLHQANHATQHRSEAALLLTRLGHSPGDLDLLVYCDMHGGEG